MAVFPTSSPPQPSDIQPAAPQVERGGNTDHVGREVIANTAQVGGVPSFRTEAEAQAFIQAQESPELDDFSSKIASPVGKLFDVMPLEKIYELIPYFSERDWSSLPKEHVKAFDFNRIDERQRIVAFDNIFHDTYGDTRSEVSKLFSDMSLERIYELAHYFSAKHWRSLPKEHVKAFDFNRLDERQRKVACENIFSNTYDGERSDAAKLLAQLDKDQIELVKLHVPKEIHPKQ